MKAKLIGAAGFIIALALFAGWKLSASDHTAYIVIVDHDVDNQRLSCGWPAITQAPNGSYFVHVHATSGDVFLSGKVVTVSRSGPETGTCK